MDLTLDSFGLTQSVIDVPAPSVSLVDYLAVACPVAVDAAFDTKGDAGSRLAREPSPCVGSISRLAPSLRI